MRRNGLFKSAMALLMVCTMSVSGLSVTAYAAGDAEVAYTARAQEATYVLMNIPYADFYRAEVGGNTVRVDAMSSATKAKTRTGSLAGGSYHVNPDGSDISGVTFPVMLGDGVTMSDLAAYTEITDEDSLEITVTNRGQTNTTVYKGKDALFESGNYSYYRMSETPSYYKIVTKEGDNLVFGETVGERTTLNNVKTTFMTSSSYGDYQLDLSDATLDSADEVYGVVIGTEEGVGYGLRHVENIWRNTKLSWCTGFTTQVHNCPTDSEHYASMMGKNINKITYYTSDGIYEIPLSKSIHVPIKFTSELSVENAAVADGKTTVSTGTLPEGFEPEYTVAGLTGASVTGTELTFPISAAVGNYTLTVSDKSGTYAPISASFTLTTDSLPVSYDSEKKVLSAADADALSAYVKNISSVSVNGKSYAASGRGATVIVNSDGTLALDAAPFAEDAESYQVVVKATGYTTDLEFTYTKTFVLMNIPYEAFYKEEVGKNTERVDAMSSATKAKTRTGSLVGGSYHVNSDGSDISGITFPVVLGSNVSLNDLAGYKEITDSDSLEITVTNRGQTNTTVYEGKDALFGSEDYSYYKSAEASSYYKVVTKDGDALTFSKTVGKATTLDDVNATFMTSSSYGDYQLDLMSAELDDAEVVYGVVIETEDGYGYGLRHLENIWLNTKLSWCTGFTEKVHNCPTDSVHYASMMGKNITKLTYYTSDGIYEIPLSESIYVPIKFENQLSVADAAAASGRTTVSTGTLPSGYEPDYKVAKLDGAAVNGTELTFPANAAIGQYTLTVSDKTGVYADISAVFTLYTESVPVSYSNAKKALVASDADALAAYVKSITSVSVDGKAYAASGRGATVLIKEDGTLATDAAPFSTEADSYTVEVTATGYKNNLVFTYAKVNAGTLQTAITSVKGLKESDYTAETWKVVKEKLAAAENALAAQASQAEIDRAVAELNAAVQKLEKAANNGGSQPPVVQQPAVKAGSIYKVGKLQYKVTKAAADGTGTVEVYAPVNKKAASLTIPKTVTIEKISFKVTSVGAKAFRKCTSLKKITIGANVTKIGKNAFQGDKKLKTITVKSKKLTSVGKAAFKGINAKAVIKVPKAKRAAYKKLFKGKGQGKKVTIK